MRTSTQHTSSPPLRNVIALNTGLNLPGPRAAQILKEMGAHIIKIEPPTGDTFEYFCKAWYEDMHQGVEIKRINLKEDSGRRMMNDLLMRANILITSQRPDALRRMGLAPEELRRRHPKLAIVNILGSAAEQAHLSGHDLTYQARAGLLDPPHMPRSLIADLAGAQQAVIAALALLHAGGGVQQVALSDAAQLYHEPLAYHLTRPGDYLGGKHAGYNIYQTADGYIALAALEHYFWPRLHDLFPDLPDNPLSRIAHDILKKHFSEKPTVYWVEQARQKDIPLEAVPTARRSP